MVSIGPAIPGLHTTRSSCLTLQSSRVVFIVGEPDWAGMLEANKQAFVEAWVERPAFQSAYGGLTNDGYVDTLISHTGVSFSQSERDALISSLNSGKSTRAERATTDRRRTIVS